MCSHTSLSGRGDAMRSEPRTSEAKCPRPSLSGRGDAMRSEPRTSEAKCPIKQLPKDGFPGPKGGAPSGGRSESDVGANIHARFWRISKAGNVLPSSTSRNAPPPVEM